MKDFSKVIEGICFVLLMIPPIYGFLLIASGKVSSDGGSWKQKRERYERERLYKQLQQNTIKYQSVPVPQPAPVYSSRSSRSNYAELWDECEELDAALEDAGIDHDDLSYPMDYHELEDLRDEYQSLLEENDIDY